MLLLLLAVPVAAGVADLAPLEALAVEHHLAANRSHSKADALLADAAYERFLALPLDDATRARCSLSHGDLLVGLGERGRAIARFQDVVRLSADPDRAQDARRSLLSAAHDLVPDWLVKPRSNSIDFGFRRPHGARDVFCCVAPPALSADEELAAEIARSLGKDGEALLALLWAAHGSAESIPALRTLLAQPGWAGAILPRLALINVLWVRGDPTLNDELDRVHAWAVKDNEAATLSEVTMLRALVQSMPPEMVRALDPASTTARWLLLLSNNGDHALRAELARVQADAQINNHPAVAWAVANLRQPLPRPPPPDLHGYADARVFWRRDTVSADDTYAIGTLLWSAADALKDCWRGTLEADPARRVETDVTVKVSVRIVDEGVADTVVEGALPAPALEGCLRDALNNKRLIRATGIAETSTQADKAARPARTLTVAAMYTIRFARSDEPQPMYR